MAADFPNSPTNGQTVTVDGVTYSWNAAGAVWDLVTTATAAVSVTAPVTNTGTSTAAILGFATNPSLSGVVNTNGGYKIDSSAQYKSYEYFTSGTRRAVLYTEETQQQLVIQNEGTGPIAFQNGSLNRMSIASNGSITTPAQPFCWISNSNTGNTTYGANAVVRFDTVRYNVGNAYSTSTNRFTAPVSGRYHVWFNAFNNTSGDGFRVQICTNGSPQIGMGGTAGADDYGQSVVLYLNANDFIDVRCQYANTVIFLAPSHAEFGATLLG
jgi:hypothetical protein